MGSNPVIEARGFNTKLSLAAVSVYLLSTLQFLFLDYLIESYLEKGQNKKSTTVETTGRVWGLGFRVFSFAL